MTRTLDFLPEIFKTAPNDQFLAATLDQLVSAPDLRKIDGFIGQRGRVASQVTDNYLIEPTQNRNEYQLEPSVVFVDEFNKAKDIISYPEIIDSLRINGANVDAHDRLFDAEYYSWDSYVDLDKLINFSQYYWMPFGPDPVDVFASDIATTDTFTMISNDTSYTVDTVTSTNPTITIARGGTYTFDVNQLGSNFWIQTHPGTSGTQPNQTNVSSREILGVTNNGISNGQITFSVPQKNAQNIFLTMDQQPQVQYATSLRFDQINNMAYNTFMSDQLGIDGQTDIINKTIIFLNQSNAAAWNNTGVLATDQTGAIFNSTSVPSDGEFVAWRIVIDQSTGTDIIKLVPLYTIPVLNKISIAAGRTYGNLEYYRTADSKWKEIPVITALLDYLYYQDSNAPDKFGIIKIVDTDTIDTLDVNSILGADNYTSPNGVRFTNGLKIIFRGKVFPTQYADNTYYIEGVGSSIKLVDERLLITPETYTKSKTSPFDSTGFDSLSYDTVLNSPQDPDYFTINRASQDVNAWSRSNRWVHVDIITASATYNKTSPIIDQSLRAKRPIIEFRKNIKLFNHGTIAKDPVDIIDTYQIDALSNVHGAVGYSVDGVALAHGMRIIFAADNDALVRNKIYVVNFIDPDGYEPGYGQIINLVEATDANILENESIVVKNGVEAQGDVYYYTGTEWKFAQQKTHINQPPLFDVYDELGHSYADTNYYTGTSFAGSQLFSYVQQAVGAVDEILKIKLKHASFNNVGDILFKSGFKDENFIYVADSRSVTQDIEYSVVREYNNRTDYTISNGWEAHITDNVTRQKFVFTYDNAPLVLDVQASLVSILPITVYIGGEFIPSTDYAVTIGNGTTTIDVNAAVGDSIEIYILSDTVSNNGFYEVPKNLEHNPLNDAVDSLTLGLIRGHYTSIAQSIPGLKGTAIGSNNTRDLGNIVPFGNVILKHSSPIPLAATFLRGKNYDFYGSIAWAGDEYEKFKNFVLSTVANNDYGFNSPANILDAVIDEYTVSKTDESPFYYGDMIPHSNDYIETNYVVSAITLEYFDTNYTYDFARANQQAILVYVNDTLLIKDKEYIIADDGPRLTILINLTLGDTVSIREYTKTEGACVPVTPSKMGMYELYQPDKYTDNSYTQPTEVIKGHDGSVTVAFGDVRDDVLLEFERRVYNNIKGDRFVPLTKTDVIPGRFRDTGFTINEVNGIINPMFLRWANTNRLDYTTQTYDKNNEFTWNYSKMNSVVSNDLLPGHWRAIYEYYYDTITPHLTPWEMLGLAEEPAWWGTRYGPLPYTKGNLVLWDDLEAGLIADPNNTHVDAKYARPGLTNVIPVDDQGDLVSPYISLVKVFDIRLTKGNWFPGDGGPVESAWKRSSAYPFAVQRMLALSKPAQYFSLYVNKDDYKYNTELNQFVVNNRKPLRLDTITINDTSPANSYINYIVDYNKVIGRNNSIQLAYDMSHIDVRLTYRMAGYTDKKYLKVIAEKTSPGSTANNLIMPDENYSLLLHKNEVSAQVIYSAVIVQKTKNGYAVFGTDLENPYFNILTSTSYKQSRPISGTNNSYNIPVTFSDRVVQVPYDTEFLNASAVVDFIISYGAMLEQQGMKFNTIINNQEITWAQVAEEFMYWTTQGWEDNSLIQLSPGALDISLSKNNLVVDGLQNYARTNYILNQNNQIIQHKDMVVTRISNDFSVKPQIEPVAFAKLNLVSYEHVLIIDNTTVFNDIIYDLATGSRQLRIKLNGHKTAKWNGTLQASGFVVSTASIDAWNTSSIYKKGDVVIFKDNTWVASETIQPSAEFDYSKWVVTNIKLDQQLLQNISTKAESFADFYSLQTVNLEQDTGLLGRGLIGYRPRKYMDNLLPDDASQVQLYSNFIPVKGTHTALDKIRNISLDKETSDYTVFENWAIKLSDYGSTANKGFIEAETIGSISSNPHTLEFVANTFTSSTADEVIPVANLYNLSESVDNGTANIFDVSYEKDFETALPTAGYVNIDDISATVFTVSDLSGLSASLTNIVEGSTVWVAKSNNMAWDIYKVIPANSIIYEVKNNFNGRSTITFTHAHTLAIADIILIKEFAELAGAYSIIEIVDHYSVVIDYAFPATSQVTVYPGSGVVFKLQSVRVKQASDISNIVEHVALDNDLVWVDDVDGKWNVLQKSSPWNNTGELLVKTDQLTNSNHGVAVSANAAGSMVLVGAPLANTVSTFLKVASGNYAEGVDVLLGVDNLVDFGATIDSGNKTWSVASAFDTVANTGVGVVIRNTPNSSQVYVQQILVPQYDYTTANDFGYAIAMSSDENWVYISAPTLAKVFAYSLVTVEKQQAIIVADGNTLSYTISDKIQFNTPSQLSVTINRIENTAWTIQGSDIVFLAAPLYGAEIIVSRKTASQLIATSAQTYDISDIYTATYTDAINVYIAGKLQKPYIDYEVSGASLVLVNTPVVGSHIDVSVHDHYKQQSTITHAVATDKFGASLSCTSDGRQLVIGAPTSTVNALTNAGSVYVYDRIVERIIADATTSVFTFTDTYNPIRVKLNDKFLVQDLQSINYDYTTTASSVQMQIAPAYGDIIELETSELMLVTSDTSTQPRLGANFGADVKVCPTDCSLYASAPRDSSDLVDAGSVVRFVNIAREYSIISGLVSSTVTGKIRINNIIVDVTGSSAQAAASAINDASIPNVKAYYKNDKITIGLINPARTSLQVLPYSNTALADLGLVIFVENQRITSPIVQDAEQFGYKLSVSTNGNTLAISTPVSNVQKEVTFDNSTTIFDSGATHYIGFMRQTGTVYLYELLQAANNSFATPSKMVYAQHIDSSVVTPYDKFGESMELVDDVLFVGAPLDDPAGQALDSGSVVVFKNNNRQKAWSVYREETPHVATDLIQGIAVINKDSGLTEQYLDFIDPINGKLLGVVRANLNYITFNDPAHYNTGNEDGYAWSVDNVGEMWWDLTNARFIDYNQSDVDFKAKRWGQLFPGSSADVYQWVESNVPPAQYSGTAYSITDYTSIAKNILGTIVVTYYFWAKDVDVVDSANNKTLSAIAISNYISNTKQSGIPYAAILDKNAIALFNVNDIVDSNTVIRVDFNLSNNTGNIHTEYELIQEGNPDSFLSSRLETKFIDSLTGSNIIGDKVPALSLLESQAFGVQFRPRQSMFIDKTAALQTAVSRINNILEWYPIVGNRNLSGLKIIDTVPSADSGAWDIKLANMSEVSYQNLNITPTGTRFLVEVDDTNSGRWAIYQLSDTKTLDLVVVQSYDTNRYWNTIDWYKDATIKSAKITKIVDQLTDLFAVKAVEGDVVKVRFNLNNIWELHQLQNSKWVNVATQGGTIQVLPSIFTSNDKAGVGYASEVFDIQYFDQEPTVEIRNILTSIFNDILIDDLAIERNKLLTMMFGYIIAEQPKVDWLMKTSLVDITHKIRALSQYSVYRRDNQEFVLDYINEAKPYHVKIKDFVLEYNSLDVYDGNVTDFDVPVYYDKNLNRFVAPRVGVENDAFWQQPQYKDWADNHLFTIKEITVINGGSGYTLPPDIIVEGTSAEPATALAKINSAGKVVGITLVTPGKAYSSTPIVRISGGNGSGAHAVAILQKPLVRSLSTAIKFDRTEYKHTIVDWTEGLEITINDLVRYINTVFRATATHIASTFFDDTKFVQATQESMMAADRVNAFYKPGINQVGNDLSLVEQGIVYPGVNVMGLDFTYNPGYDLGNFDVKSFSTITYGPEGYPTVDNSSIDSIIESSMTDSYLGTRPEDITIDGGAFIDEYSSHSPEELVPGRSFDTLDIEVYTRPGFDYLGNGFGPDIQIVSYTYSQTTSNNTVSFADAMSYPAAVKVFSTKYQALVEGIDYTVNWTDLTVTSLVNHISGDILQIYVYSIAGGYKLYENIYTSNNIVNDTIVISENYNNVYESIVLVNGVFLIEGTDYYIWGFDNNTFLYFVNPITTTDRIYVVLQGFEQVVHNTSTLKSQTFTVANAPVYPAGYTFTLPFVVSGSAKMNMVVELNGLRLRSPAGIRHVRNSGQQIFPTINTIDVGFTPNTVSNNEFAVFVNSIELLQTVDYDVLLPQFGVEHRDVEIYVPLTDGDVVEVYITRAAEYRVDNGISLLINPSIQLHSSDNIVISTYGDYSQLTAITRVFEGPRPVPVINDVTFDSVGFGNALFDQYVIDTRQANRFDLKQLDQIGFASVGYGNDIFDQLITDATIFNGNRLWVTLDGNRLHYNIDYIIEGTEVVIQGSVIANNAIVIITSITNNIAPISTGFRLFKDMRDNYRAFRLDSTASTELTQPLLIDDTIIYVDDASKLPPPNLVRGVFGSITIGAERIYYRERDIVTNELRGIRRGVGGTGVIDHGIGTVVFDTSKSQLVDLTSYSANDVYTPEQIVSAEITTLTHDLKMGDTVIHVASTDNLWLDTKWYTNTLGDIVEYVVPSAIIVDNEKVFFTEINHVDKTVSGLYRDQAGVGAYVVHTAGSPIYDSTLAESAEAGTWYELDLNSIGVSFNPSNGVPLQQANTAQAVFIREHGVVLPR